MDEFLRPVLEIGMIYVFLLLSLRFVRGSTADSALKGTAILVAVGFGVSYIIARSLDLYRIELILDKLFDYAIFALIIIFQPELRRGVVRLGRNRVFGRFMASEEDVVSLLGTCVYRLSAHRTGALIVVERGVGLSEYADRGTPMDARLSPELVEAVFHKDSPLHDGAVILRGARIVAASCFFPLTSEMELAQRFGTRHRAGIGISEDSDGISIIVSEESGNVSIAIRGELLEDLDRSTFER
ncbi:MAG: diadenylate cyclase CdaA, partial [Planctomycetes bacterium]|nr:diadenylate cyclase CdaA [Planctomycetota bacterium]